MGTKFGARALNHLITQINVAFDPTTGKCETNADDTATLLGMFIISHSVFAYSHSIPILGLIGRDVLFTPLKELEAVTDFGHRLPKDQWWLKIRPLLRILAKHHATYVQEAA